MTTRIYERPDLDQRATRLALYITGALPNAKPGEAYDGRLQVHNGIGGLTVQQIDGDQLPNGTSLYIVGSEVVLAWPAYSETAATIPNPGFELGDTGWSKGPGWSIGTENPIAGARSARYGENQGSSLIESAARYPVNPGQSITATCQVRQGASAEGNAGAAVQLQWRRQDGTLLDTSEGNAVMSASKNRVYPSTVVATPPAGSALVNIASRGIRTRENKALFIDSFVWDHQQLTGVNQERTFNVTLRVADSAGRSAIWRGAVLVLSIGLSGVIRTGTLDSSTGLQIGQVAYSKLTGKFHVCKNGRQTSSNGVNWITASTASYSAAAANADTGAFLGLNGTTLVVETAPDVFATISSNTADAYRNLSYGNGKCVGMGSSYSSVGYSGAWVAGSAGQSMDYTASPARWFPEAGLWVAVNALYKVVTSANGLSWADTGITVGAVGASFSEAPAYSPTARAVVVHGTDANIRRFDGTTWETIALPNPSINGYSKNFGKVIYATRLDRFVLTSMYGLYTSVDGRVWTKITDVAADGSPLGFIASWNAVTDGDDRIVFFGAFNSHAMLYTNAPDQ